MIFLDTRQVLLIYVQGKHCVKTAKINFNKKKNKQTNKQKQKTALCYTTVKKFGVNKIFLFLKH